MFGITLGGINATHDEWCIRDIITAPIKYTAKLSSAYPLSIPVRDSWGIRPLYLIAAGKKKRA